MFVFQSNLRPRNPLVRLIGGILGLIVVVGLIAVGFFAFVALFIGGAIWYGIHLLRSKRPGRDRSQRKATKTEDGVIDGEFTVVVDSGRRIRVEHVDRNDQQRQ